MRNLFALLALAAAPSLVWAADSSQSNSSQSKSQQTQQKPENPDDKDAKAASAKSTGTINASGNSRGQRNESIANNEEKAAGAVTDAVKSNADAEQIEYADANASDANIARSKNAVSKGLDAKFEYKSAYGEAAGMAAHAKILELAGYSANPDEVRVAKSRQQIAEERAKLARDASRQGGSKGGIGLSDPSLGQVGEIRSDEAIAMVYTIVPLPNPIVMHYIDRRTDAKVGLPAWVDGNLSNRSLRDTIWYWLHDNLLPIVAWLAIGTLILRFFWQIYNTTVASRPDQAAKRLTLSMTLFLLSALMINYGHSVAITVRNSLAQATIQMQMSFNAELSGEFGRNGKLTEMGNAVERVGFAEKIKNDPFGYNTMLQAMGVLQQKRLVASTNNEDQTLSDDLRKQVEDSINKIPDANDRKPVYGDFCVLRLNLYNAYCKAVDDALDKAGDESKRNELIENNAELIAAKDAFTKFLDDRNLFSGNLLKDVATRITAAMVNLVTKVRSPVSSSMAEIAMVVGYVFSWVIGFCVDVAFIFILVTIPLRTITVENPLALLTPFLEVAALSFYALCVMFFRSLGLYFIFKATGTITAVMNSMSFNLYNIEEPNEVYLWIGIALVTLGQVWFSWVLTKLCFPKVQLTEIAQSVYGGGAAIGGGIVSGVSAAVGAVGMFTPAAPVTTAVSGAGGAAGKAVSKSGKGA